MCFVLYSRCFLCPSAFHFVSLMCLSALSWLHLLAHGTRFSFAYVVVPAKLVLHYLIPLARRVRTVYDSVVAAAATPHLYLSIISIHLNLACQHTPGWNMHIHKKQNSSSLKIKNRNRHRLFTAVGACSKTVDFERDYIPRQCAPRSLIPGVLRPANDWR